MRLQLINETSVMVYFADNIITDTADTIACAYHHLEKNLDEWLIDITPSYTSILLAFDLNKIGLQGFSERLTQALASLPQPDPQTRDRQTLTLPVYYHPEVALDSQVVSEHCGMVFEEVVARHCAQNYRVFAIGFTPGFAYLGNLASAIQMPRKQNPRANIPRGSVAIADSQTAIYPRNSPGGWQVIGRTPVNLFDPQSPNLSPYSVGDCIRFEPIDRDTFLALGGEL